MHRGILLCCLWMMLATAPAKSAPGEPPLIPVGLDAYRMWERLPYQRLGARAYMRSTYDRRGRNESADASHFLYQEAEDFNVTLDVEGRGVLYFIRTNHWHGSPWHYEVDGTDHLVQETSTADPNHPVEGSVFLPEAVFPNPLTWTWSITKGADLMWVPIPFEESFRLAYSRTFYGTGYYIYHQFLPDAPLSRPIVAWDGLTPPASDVLELIQRSGTDIAPKNIERKSATLRLAPGRSQELVHLTDGPAVIRAIRLSVPEEQAIAFGRGRLRITWDDRPEASVEAPLALFFGAGTLYNRDGREYLVKGFPINIRSEEGRLHLACYYPMPFFRSARIELEDCDVEPGTEIDYEVRWEPYVDPPSHVGYFHATYRDHPDLERGKDVELLDTRQVEGGGDWSGSFVGTSFIFSHEAVLNTLEGDPRFFFDDSLTPQAYGTGTEEWGGGGDYWGGRNMTLPFAGHPCGARSPQEARNPEDRIESAYRFLIADLMPFGKNAVIRLEHGSENQSTEHYETVTYWYGLPSPSLVKTDEINIGDLASESAHQYASPEASPPYRLTSRYEWGIDSHSMSRYDGPLARPEHYVEWEFEADADKTYILWVRGRSDSPQTDSFWVQVDDSIGTTESLTISSSSSGAGNWRDARDSRGDYAWSSGRPEDRPLTVRFKRPGQHRLRIQPRESGHRLDQIRLSATQESLPLRPNAAPAPLTSVPGAIDEIVLDCSNIAKRAGQIRVAADVEASIDEALEIDLGPTIVFPAHTETGRHTAGRSEFTLKLRPENLGVLLRRTLDYSFPNQRAVVSVADVSQGQGGDALQWEPAGIWYLAGSNTCYHSYPLAAGELGAAEPQIQTSNRRFRDDEFLLARKLTQGRSAIRVRVDFTPVERPLLPGGKVPPLAWSELRYHCYCYIMPEFTLE